MGSNKASSHRSPSCWNAPLIQGHYSGARDCLSLHGGPLTRFVWVHSARGINTQHSCGGTSVVRGRGVMKYASGGGTAMYKRFWGLENKQAVFRVMEIRV